MFPEAHAVARAWDKPNFVTSMQIATVGPFRDRVGLDAAFPAPEASADRGRTHRLQQQWHTVDPLELEDAARDLWRDERLRSMPPEAAAVEWLKPITERPGSVDRAAASLEHLTSRTGARYLTCSCPESWFAGPWATSSRIPPRRALDIFALGAPRQTRSSDLPKSKSR
jgi:hypothetical protein